MLVPDHPGVGSCLQELQKTVKLFLLQIFRSLFLFQLIKTTHSQWCFKDLVYDWTRICRPGRVFRDHSVLPSHFTGEVREIGSGITYLKPHRWKPPGLAQRSAPPPIKFALSEVPKKKRGRIWSPHCASFLKRSELSLTPALSAPPWH